jgi:hypothetical protein
MQVVDMTSNGWHMRPHMRRGPMEHWAQVQIDGLEATECPLDPGQGLVGSHGPRSIDLLGWLAGAQQVKAIEPVDPLCG